MSHVRSWRRLQPQFPVMPWSDLVDVIRDQVNPLAGAEHVHVVLHQLQLMGEVGRQGRLRAHYIRMTFFLVVTALGRTGRGLPFFFFFFLKFDPVT